MLGCVDEVHPVTRVARLNEKKAAYERQLRDVQAALGDKTARLKIDARGQPQQLVTGPDPVEPLPAGRARRQVSLAAFLLVRPEGGGEEALPAFRGRTVNGRGHGRSSG